MFSMRSVSCAVFLLLFLLPVVVVVVVVIPFLSSFLNISARRSNEGNERANAADDAFVYVMFSLVWPSSNIEIIAELSSSSSPSVFPQFCSQAFTIIEEFSLLLANRVCLLQWCQTKIFFSSIMENSQAQQFIFIQTQSDKSIALLKKKTLSTIETRSADLFFSFLPLFSIPLSHTSRLYPLSFSFSSSSSTTNTCLTDKKILLVNHY